MNQLVLNLPWPPSVNSYWRSPNKGPLAGRTLISEKGRQYRRDAKTAVFSSLVVPSTLSIREPWHALQGCRLSVALYAFPPDKRRRDLDNLPKAVLDALTHAGVWADDEQIDSLSIKRCGIERGGRLKVVIFEMVAAHGPTDETNEPVSWTTGTTA